MGQGASQPQTGAYNFKGGNSQQPPPPNAFQQGQPGQNYVPPAGAFPTLSGSSAGGYASGSNFSPTNTQTPGTGNQAGTTVDGITFGQGQLGQAGYFTPGIDPWTGMPVSAAQSSGTALPAGTSMANGVPTAPSPSIQPQGTQTASAVGATPPVLQAPYGQVAPPPSQPVTPFNPGGGLATGGQDVATMMQQAQQAAYQQATQYLDPQYQQAQAALQSQLVNQGIPQGSQAWNTAMDNFSRQRQQAYSGAENAAYGQGLTAQNQVAQQLLTQMGYGNQQSLANIGANASMFGTQSQAQTGANSLQEQTQQDLFNNSMGMRNQDLNELLLQQQNPLTTATALTNGTAPTSPNFTQTPSSTVDPTNIASIIQQALGQQNNVYNTGVGATNSANSGIAAMIAALVSDRRLKTNIKQLGMHESGVPFYSYNYATGEPGFGVMADELEKVRPDAVWRDGNGIQMVNYGAISRKQ